MAQHPHVPRFGNWERENITYTAYFETARKGRGAGGRILNPNDPEEIRPELINRDEQHRVVVPPGNNGKSSHGSSTVRPPSTANTATSNRNVHVTQQSSHHQEKKRRSKEADAASVGHTRSVPDHGDQAHHKGSANAQRSRKGFGSDDSCSSASLIHSHQSQSRSKDAIEQKRHDVPYHGDHAHHKGSANAQRSRKGFGSDESCSSASLIHSHQSQSRSKDAVEQKRHHDVLPPMSPQQQPMSRTKKDRQEDAHHRAASVPKFGAWDVSSPQPGAGFTMIFDKVKEERQNAASKLPPAVLINNHGTYSPHQGISDGKPIKPKMFCCFLPMVG